MGLQGCVIRATHTSTKQKVAIKITNQILHKNKITSATNDGKFKKIDEDIIKEASILRYLANDGKCHDSIVKFVDLFQSDVNIFFVMSDSGLSLFEFVQRGHRLIRTGQLDISEWHRVIKIIFKQMAESITYIHSKQIVHFDISLENYLINDICIETSRDGKIKFHIDDKHPVRVTLCDFGLAEYYPNANQLSNKFCGKVGYKSPEVTSEETLFEPKKNDIWCLGICLYKMILGAAPWQTASLSDLNFLRLMDGDLLSSLKESNRLPYINAHLVELFCAFFRFEETRISMAGVMECTWLKQ